MKTLTATKALPAELDDGGFAAAWLDQHPASAGLPQRRPPRRGRR